MLLSTLRTMLLRNTAQKAIFYFSKYSQKMAFPKKFHRNIFLVSSEKMILSGIILPEA